MLERLGVAEVVDAVVPRRADAGATVGTYLALACANRVVTPCSKLGFADWWSTTAGPRWVKVPAAALDHRRFWEAMSLLDEGDLATIEAELGRRIVREFDLDLSGLILDMTNFATYIDSGNDKAPIAQRGKAKQKRVDLRLVGLGLIVTRDVISQTHRQHRAVEFKKFLIAIDKAVPAELDVHLVCDRPSGTGWPNIHASTCTSLPPARPGSTRFERWIAYLTCQLLRRGVHTSVAALEKDVREWINNWNEDPKPFVWTIDGIAITAEATASG
jgi:hypothetical protein